MRTNVIQFLFLHIKMHHNAGWLPLQYLGYLTDNWVLGILLTIKFSLYKKLKQRNKRQQKTITHCFPLIQKMYTVSCFLDSVLNTEL